MKNLRDKFTYWKKRMTFRLVKRLEAMVDWYERNPLFAYVGEKICDICIFVLKVFIAMEIVYRVAT